VGCHTINKLGTMSLAAYFEELLSQRMQSSGEKPGVTPTTVTEVHKTEKKCTQWKRKRKRSAQNGKGGR
jgi:hypothetical protein